MKQITVRGFDDQLDEQLRQLAKQRDISITKAAVFLMRKGAGLRPDNSGPEVVGQSLDSFIGSWSVAQEQAVRDAVRDLETVDTSFWK